jgi:hypothetical protein
LTQVFWSIASARSRNAAGKILVAAGFGRERTAIGLACKAGDGALMRAVIKGDDVTEIDCDLQK